MKALAIILSAAVAVSAATTQEPAVKKPMPGVSSNKPAQATAAPSANAAATDKPQPGPEMKKLARLLVGRWQVEEKYDVTPITPQGGEGKGTHLTRLGPGGFSVISSYKSNGTMGEYRGTGIITWSAGRGTFEQYWVDSSVQGGELWSGKWEGEALVLHSTQKMGEQTIHWRERFDGFSNDGFTLTFEMGPSAEEMKRCMTFKFTRIAREASGRRRGMGMYGRPTVENPFAPSRQDSYR